MSEVARRGGGEGDLLSAILDALPASVFAKDLEGHYLLVNRHWETLLDRRREEILGRTDEALFPPEIAGALRAGDRTALETGAPVVRDATVPLPDGPHACLAMESTLSDAAGKLIGVCGILADITAQKRAEAALETGEQCFRLLADTVREYGVILLDGAGKVFYINSAAERLLGCRADQIAGRDFAAALGGPPDALRRAAAEGRLRQEDWRVRRDGSRFRAEILLSPLRSRDGSLRGFLEISRELAPAPAGRPQPFAAELTPRQNQVLKLVAEGHSAKEIAAILGISVKTVEFHRSAIGQRLGIRTIAELTKYALEKGLVSEF